MLLLVVLMLSASAQMPRQVLLSDASRNILAGELDCSDPRKSVDVQNIALKVDVWAHRAKATISLEACRGVVELSANLGIVSVRDVRGRDLQWTQYEDFNVPATQPKRFLRVVLPPRVKTIVVDYFFSELAKSEGFLRSPKTDGVYGLTGIWPYYCGNIMPCHPVLTDSITFQIDAQNLPYNMTVVAPKSVSFPSPSYMPAFAVGDYKYMSLGQTEAGTEIGACYYPGSVVDDESKTTKSHEEVTKEATKYLKNSFNWLEKNIGPYKFGKRFASVMVRWEDANGGGMEYEPFIHIGVKEWQQKSTHTHEAGHSWFGDGVRIRSWNDFMLSEGTNSYITVCALEVQHPDMAKTTWATYGRYLIGACRNDTVKPVVSRSPNADRLDVLDDDIFTNRPYYKGTWFYKQLAEAMGPDGKKKVIDILSSFYKKWVGKAASVQDMLDHIDATGFSSKALAETWLFGLGIPNYIFDVSTMERREYIFTGLTVNDNDDVEGSFVQAFIDKKWDESERKKLREHIEDLAIEGVNQANICSLIKNGGRKEAWCSVDKTLLKNLLENKLRPQRRSPPDSGHKKAAPVPTPTTPAKIVKTRPLLLKTSSDQKALEALSKKLEEEVKIAA